MYVKLKAGKHKVSYSFKATSPYLASSGSTYLKVKNPITKGHGYWVLSSSMYSLNLKKLKLPLKIRQLQTQKKKLWMF